MKKSLDVTIVDLGLGNMHSVVRAFERANARPVVTADADVVRRAVRIVVPGQGAIKQCSIALQDGLGDALFESMKKGVPYLGICLGMQMLFEHSEEAPGFSGLGFFKGEVVRFTPQTDIHGGLLKVPHMGWNQVSSSHPYLDNQGWYYFVHSYYCVPTDDSIVVGRTDYGLSFCSALAKDNVFACQFHPEKSHHLGARLLERFMETT